VREDKHGSINSPEWQHTVDLCSIHNRIESDGVRVEGNLLGFKAVAVKARLNRLTNKHEQQRKILDEIEQIDPSLLKVSENPRA